MATRAPSLYNRRHLIGGAELSLDEMKAARFLPQERTLRV
jgi:hypothetical protein